MVMVCSRFNPGRAIHHLCFIDMVFDTEGYHSHSHSKDHSGDTITGNPRSLSPVSSEEDQTPGPSRKIHSFVHEILIPRIF